MVDEDDRHRRKFLVLAVNASRTLGKSTHETWLHYFDEGKGSQMDCVAEAFLAYWLSRYILPSGPEDNLN